MKPLSPQQWDKVKLHCKSDVTRMRLAHHGDADMDAVITQIECRQRTGKKLSHTLSLAPFFLFPSVLSAEQSTSDTLATYHASLCSDCRRVLDLTCGLGIDAFHIAQTVSCVTACEINPDTAACATHNAKLLHLENVTVVNGDSVQLLGTFAPDSFDCIFIDPARRSAQGKRLFALSDCNPDVTALLPRLLIIAPLVIIKASPMLDITQTLRELSHVERVIALGDRRECKELVAICSRGFDGPAKIESITLDSNGNSVHFAYLADEEANAIPEYGIPEEGYWLYEPFPSAIKSGAFNCMATRYNVSKIAANSHLYHSPALEAGFSGRAFRVERVVPFNRKGIREISTLLSKAEVSTRNFPMKPEQLLAKLRLKQGGDMRIFATRSETDNALLILTSPLP